MASTVMSLSLVDFEEEDIDLVIWGSLKVGLLGLRLVGLAVESSLCVRGLKSMADW